MAYEIEEAKRLDIEAGKKLIETGRMSRTWGNFAARITDNPLVIAHSVRA